MGLTPDERAELEKGEGALARMRAKPVQLRAEWIRYRDALLDASLWTGRPALT